MASHWLVYWKSDEIEYGLTSGSIPFVQSSQLKKVRPGDTLWVCGKRTGHGPELITIGFLLVERIVPSEDAARLRSDIKVFADFVALPKPGEECVARLLGLQPLYRSLRFESESSPRLAMASDGHPAAQQLQTYRQLTPKGSRAIQEAWSQSLVNLPNGSRALVPSSIQSAASSSAADLAAPSSERLRDWLESLDALDVARLAFERAEQKHIRRFLLGGRESADCAICGGLFPAELLRAAHIKPRSQCSDEEKRDMENVSLMCALGCDALFERGFVYVSCGMAFGNPKRMGGVAANDVRITAVVGRRVKPYAPARERYFEWHRANICGC